MSQPQSPPARRRFRYWPETVVILLAGLALAAYAAYHIGYPTGTAEKEADSPELDLCRRFMALKNDRDPAAGDLLGPAPVVPTSPVSPEEADRLHAEFFLHDNYRVASVQPETEKVSGSDARFVLALKGGVSSPIIRQTGPNGTDAINRSLSDPDIIVRVEGKKILAVSWRLHHDPNEKQPSEEDKRQFREYLVEQQRQQLRNLQGTGRR